MPSHVMNEMGLDRHLGDDDIPHQKLIADIDYLFRELHLPKNVKIEALKIAMKMSGNVRSGVRIREKAVYCVYMAGKRHKCVQADITRIHSVLSKVNPSLTRGRMTKSIWRLHKRIDMESIAPSDVQAHVDHTFRLLMGGHSDNYQEIIQAYRRVPTLLKDAQGSSPRRKAADVCLRALKMAESKLGSRELSSIMGFSIRD